MRKPISKARLEEVDALVVGIDAGKGNDFSSVVIGKREGDRIRIVSAQTLLPGERVNFNAARSGMTAEEFAGTVPERKPGLRTTSKRERDRYHTQVANMLQEKSWSSARPGHLVALYARCHEQVYRVAPGELEEGKTFALATIQAAKFARDEFKGDLEEVVRYAQWAWNRELARTRKNAGKGSGEVRRLGWRLFFSRSMATDYRVTNAERKER